MAEPWVVGGLSRPGGYTGVRVISRDKVFRFIRCSYLPLSHFLVSLRVSPSASVSLRGVIPKSGCGRLGAQPHKLHLLPDLCL